MKLAIYFGLDTPAYVVNWDKNLMDYHHYFIFNGLFWQWTMHDKDATFFGDKTLVGISYHLIYGKIHENGIPVDMFGVRFPVLDFKRTYGIIDPIKKCECGAEKVHGKNTGHATWCSLWSKP